MRPKPIAVQLYTVREAAAQDFAGVLRRVAQIGFKGVEFAGLQGMSADDVKDILDDTDLMACAAHGPMPTKDNVDQIVDEFLTLDCPRLVTGPGGPIDTLEGIKSCVEQLNTAIDLLAGSGLQFGLHNHWAEFQPVEGQLPEDILLAEVPGLFAELDIYWIAVGGPDPEKTVRRLQARAPLLHVKDGMIDPPQPHTAVGQGKLNIPAICGAASEDVLEWLIVELDSCGTDMWQAVEDSYRYMIDKGLARGNE